MQPQHRSLDNGTKSSTKQTTQSMSGGAFAGLITSGTLLAVRCATMPFYTSIWISGWMHFCSPFPVLDVQIPVSSRVMSGLT